MFVEMLFQEKIDLYYAKAAEILVMPLALI